MILKERMRKLWMWHCGARCSSREPRLTLPHSDVRKKYEKNLEGMKKIAFLTNVIIICNWFLSFCALTWASAVLLGGYIQHLSIWDYYDVSFLLFVEGLRFGIAALLHALGYRLSDFYRWALRSVAFFLPLGMGGFAVVSMLPYHVRRSIHVGFVGQENSYAIKPAPPPSDSSIRNLFPSLKIFYILILLNAFVLLLGSSITFLMRQRYVRSGVKSLCKFHDKMMDSSTSWLHPAIDLTFAFQIQGSQYRKGREASYVCTHYADLIYFLYVHDKGVEAAEAALASEDAYVREAAANIIGFWAVLRTLEDVEELKVPLCFQKGMLSELAHIAAQSYTSLGTAAARSFGLLLDLENPELVGMVASVRSKWTGHDLIDILLIRAAELLYPPCPLYRVPQILQRRSHAHIYALSRYLIRLRSLRSASETSSNDMTTTLFEAQQAQLVRKIGAALPQMVNEVSADVSHNGSDNESLIQTLEGKLCHLLGPDVDHNKYQSDIKQWLTAPPPRPYWASPIKASFLLLFNVAVPLACLGVGVIVNALFFKYTNEV